jgi:predicted secreted acid phosphatase
VQGPVFKKFSQWTNYSQKRPPSTQKRKSKKVSQQKQQNPSILMRKLKSIKTTAMKEYKFIKQKSTPIKKDIDFEALLNSYAKTGWKVVNTFVHRGVVKAVLERDKKEA